MIVVTGSLNMDFVVRVRRLPAPGETVLGSDFRMIPGGKGANQACAAGKLAAGRTRVRMVGRVGYDPFADHLKASLAAAGVEVAAVHASRDHATGVAFIGVDDSGQNSIIVASGANLALSVDDIHNVRETFAGATVALFQLETPLATVAEALRVAKAAGAITILDPAPARPLDKELLELVDILTPNENEATVVGRGAHATIFKLGERGCRYEAHEGTIESPGFKVEAVDTTAAGDTFNGALAVALAERQPLEQALRFANAAAALSVTRAGAQASIPTRAETEKFTIDGILAT